jgi:hypothetical protein
MIGVQGNEAAQARVFAHDAEIVYTDARVMWLDDNTLKRGTGYAPGTTAGVATSGTGVPAGLTVDVTANADGEITGVVINTNDVSGVDGSTAVIAGGTGGSINIRTTFPGSDQRGCCLYVGGAGDVNVTLESGNTVIFAGVNAGSFLPICATQVLAASTTATNMLALY